jgi:hypothetical protein
MNNYRLIYIRLSINRTIGDTFTVRYFAQLSNGRASADFTASSAHRVGLSRHLLDTLFLVLCGRA